MKTVRTSYSKELRALLETDEEFRKLPIMRHARALIDFVVEAAESNRFPEVFVRRDSKDPLLWGFLSPILHEAYLKSARIEAYIFPGVANACVGVNIFFYPPGNKSTPVLGLTGGADSQAIRKLQVVRR